MKAVQPRRVFISYAHESTAHIEAVRQLWTILRANGVDARLDLPATAQRNDWPLWMLEQFKRADFVLVVASAAYSRRTAGEADAGEGRGVQFEGGILRELYYSARPTWTRRILPVVLPGESKTDIPLFLGPTSATSYQIKELSTAGIEKLLRVITDQPAVIEPPLGPLPVLPQTTATAATPTLTSSAADDAMTDQTAPAAPRRPIDELSALANAFGKLPEFATAPGRYQAILLLPPDIRGAIYDAPNAHLHIISMIQACARFGPAGREALLDLLRAVLPASDPTVQQTIALIRSASLFE
ncbi:SEFIR domain-containing protein [Micromonospora sp. NPDC048894]|uniref:SEFIR domain-containing protein n=1 Tax=Micromonospora sp. NPDC048894 TaxID=3155493 RepID=UPI0033FCF912